MSKRFFSYLTISCLVLSSGIQKFTLILALLLAAVLGHAQVTIGSTTPPNKGSLLDLKDSGTYSNGETAVRGLAMPRVELSNLNPTTPADLAKSIGNATGSYDMAAHIGLIVYNVKEDICNPTSPSVGLHVWDGTTWVGLSDAILAPEVKEFIDPRDNEVYLYRNFGAAGDWMLENLRYDPIAHPDAAFTGFVHSAVNSTAAKHYAYSEGNGTYTPANHPSSEWTSKKQNGLLYNWAAATNGENTSTVDQGEGNGAPNPTPGNIQQVGVQGICPPSWHVPSDKEFNQLEAVFAASTTEYTNTAATPFSWLATYNTDVNLRPNTANVFGHGKSMKSPCPPVGSTIATGGDSKTAAAGGFNLLFAGYAYGVAYNYGFDGYLWSSSSYDGFNAWSRLVVSGSAGVARDSHNRPALFSVRCKKN